MVTKANLARVELDTDKTHWMALLKGNIHSFEEIFRELYSPLCTYSQGIVCDKSIAEDIVQDTFAYLWYNRDSINIQTSLKSYLYSSIRNRSLNYLQHQIVKREHAERLTEFITYLQETEYSETELSELEEVRKALEELPEQCRTVFLLNCLEEKSYKQIATELNISVNTVKTHLSKAYRRLRKRIKKETLLLFLVIRKCSHSEASV